ncbi:MAG TPA: DegQ family serine endoprotease [Nitrospinota bacterium]|nr:DegQ family serine endoprotease [Nitrospinota bacterium]
MPGPELDGHEMKRMKVKRGCFVAVTLAAFLLAGGAAGAERRPGSFADLVERLKPTVVNIQVTIVRKSAPFGMRSPFGRRNDPFEEFFRRFFGDQPPREFRNRAIGSGFIISPDGYLVTNNHVVRNATAIKVKLHSGEEFTAKLIGRDPKTDLALLKIEPKKALPFTKFGDSDALRVGDWVVAIGNPFGLSHTVTAGIVSAKGRVIGQGPYDDFIQTDASINQGNSGGPLFNTRGVVVGINTAISARGAGIGFAIPANMAKTLIDQLRETGSIVRGFLGVRIQNLNPKLAKRFGVAKAEGALVSNVNQDSPASRAGIKRGDVIIEFDGKRIRTTGDLVRRVGNTSVGKSVEMRVLRDGREVTLAVKVGELSEERAASTTGVSSQKLGVEIRPVPPDRAKALGLPAGQGLLVAGVDPDSPAARGGIRPGDIILEVNGQAISAMGDLSAALAKTKGDEDHLFYLHRNKSKLYASVPKG